MRLEWRETASSGWRRVSLRDMVEGAVAGLGAAIAIGAMEWLSVASHFPLVIIPFATSIVLVIGSPEAEPAQPRALIGGHLVATLAGLAMLQLTGPHGWAAAAAVFQQPSLVILVRTGAGGRRAAGGVCLCLAPLDPPPAVAATLVLRRPE